MTPAAAAAVAAGVRGSGYNNGVGAWTKCEMLGRGAHGVVYRGVAAGSGESIAVKQIQLHGMGGSELQVTLMLLL